MIFFRPETHTIEPVKAFTKDGIENTFGEISVITTIRKDKLVPMTKKFGANFKEVLVFDRIKEELRCKSISGHSKNILKNHYFQDILCQPYN